VAAQRELEQAEEVYQDFRERNPMVALSENRQSTVNKLASQQTILKSNGQIRETLRQIMSLNPADKSFEEESSQYQRKIGFLNTQDVPGANIAVSEYTRLNSERQRLLSNNFPPQHPQVLNIEKQLSDLGKDIDEVLVEFEGRLQRAMRSLRNDIRRQYQNLKNLPGSELQLAELDRNKLIKEGVVSSIMSKIEEAKVSDAAVISDAYVIDEAEPAFKTEKPIDKIILPFIGPLLGLLLGVGLVILLDLFDNTVKSVSDLESKTNLKVLATIPIIINEKNVPGHIKARGELDPKLITSDFAPVLASEQFRFIRTKLSFEDHMDPKCIIITSIAPGDGKSLISANLAVTFAQQKVSTLIIDCDLRRGVLHKTFNCLKKPGISDLLISGHEIDENILSEAAQETHVPHLYFISTGLQVPNPSELLGSIRMRDMLETFKESFQMIILDTPPIEFIPDALALNTFVHNILLVAREGKTSINVIKYKLNEFSKIGSDFKYVVLNASREVDAHAYSSYSYYNY
jgi:tyrosine-protein kinase Etk/Wzc